MRIMPMQPRTNGGGIERIEVKTKQISYDIRESGVLVSGGGGAAKSFAKIERLAELLGGKASASRRIRLSRSRTRTIPNSALRDR